MYAHFFFFSRTGVVRTFICRYSIHLFFLVEGITCRRLSIFIPKKYLDISSIEIEFRVRVMNNIVSTKNLNISLNFLFASHDPLKKYRAPRQRRTAKNKISQYSNNLAHVLYLRIFLTAYPCFLL